MSTSSVNKPHIIHIHVESMDGRMFGAAGNQSLESATPNIDSIAANGIRFTNAYSNYPVCNPSRASMFTGQYAHHYDCWNNHEGLRPSTATLFDLLQSSGYRTHAIGPIDYEYGLHSIRDRIGSWTRAAGIMRPICRTPIPEVSASKDFFSADRQRTDESVQLIHNMADADEPTYLYFTTGLVHPAFQAHPGHMACVDSGRIEVPPTLFDMDATTHPVLRYIRATKHCENRFSESLVLEMRHIYAAMVVALDELVGRILQAVRASGSEDHTWIIFSSDHGEMAGEQNQVLKRTMFEPSIHVPLVVAGPDCVRGETYDTPVSIVDLYPTILELAGIRYEDACGSVSADKASLPDAPVGETLVPQFTSMAPRSRDWAFAEYHGDRCLTGTYMIRRGSWKYVRYEGFAPQLYNIDNDRWEEHDIARDHPDVVRRLDELLTSNIDCEEIDRRAKRYDKTSFQTWRDSLGSRNEYEDTMSRVYSGFDHLCIEDIMLWRDEDEQKIRAWMENTD
jgi:arylsulfatase K